MLAQRRLNLNQVAERFSISRPAVSQHIKILTECGLVVIHKKGREHYCEAKLERLSEISHWIAQYKQFWEEKLDAMEMVLMELQDNSTENEDTA